MKSKILISTLSLCSMLVACNINSQSKTNTADSVSVDSSLTTDTIPYTIAKNYFAVIDGYKSVVIDKQTDFDATFNPAAVMGKDGEPTNINFDKQFVAGIILPETNKATEIVVKSLKKEGEKLSLVFQVQEGEKRDYTIRPMSFIIIDKAYYAPTDIQVETLSVSPSSK